MLPPVSDPTWSRLITGEARLKSSNPGICMLLHNAQLRFKQDPSTLADSVARAHAFFVRFEYRLHEEIRQLRA